MKPAINIPHVKDGDCGNTGGDLENRQTATVIVTHRVNTRVLKRDAGNLDFFNMNFFHILIFYDNMGQIKQVETATLQPFCNILYQSLRHKRLFLNLQMVLLFNLPLTISQTKKTNQNQ